MRTRPLVCSLLVLFVIAPHVCRAQDTTRRMKPEDTEVWKPVPKIITPGRTDRDAPSDAIVLFGGDNVGEWVQVEDKSPAKWTVGDGMMTVNKKAGDIQTKRSFTNFQLHLEWRVPPNVTGKGQERGNGGVYLAYPSPDGYELQILDSYVNGQAASIYKQYPPLANAMRKPGEWQTYDVVWTAPTFNANGSLKSPAFVTAIHNGVLVQNHVTLKGVTKYTGLAEYKPHRAAPIMLQAHGDPSPPLSFRNIWVRELP
jgi:hypothetical protein